MAWQQLHLTLNTDPSTTALEHQLQTLGALSITFIDAADQPIFEPAVGDLSLWQHTQLIALFAAEVNLQAIATQLLILYPEIIVDTQIELLAEQDWQRRWLEYFKPIKFGEHLWIIPSNYAIPDPKATNIFLDPGLAFGSGTHPTTAMCLQWLATHEIKNRTVIDYGCGSGILAIAALKLGAKSVWAIDHDPQALIATAENAKRNQIAKEKLYLGDCTALPKHYQADILLANILAQPLIELAPLFARCLPTGGKIVISGILTSQKSMLENAYQTNFAMLTEAQQGDWSCLSGQKIQ